MERLDYRVVLFVHVLGAIIWVGTVAALQVLVLRADRSDDPQRLVSMAHEAEWLGTRVLTPVSIVLFFAGSWMLATGPHGLREPWLLFGVAAFFTSALIGALYLGPQGKRLRALIDAHGVTDRSVREQLRRIFLVSRLEFVMLIAVVFAMVVKPGTTVA